MFGAKQSSPQAGDRVQVETLGTVVALEERAGVKGALIELDCDDHQVSVPLKFLRRPVASDHDPPVGAEAQHEVRRPH